MVVSFAVSQRSMPDLRKNEILQTEAGELIHIDNSGRTLDFLIALTPPQEPSSDTWQIYETLVGIEYGKPVQDLVGYRFPQQAWPAFISGKIALATKEKAFLSQIPSLVGDAGKVVGYPFLYQEFKPIEAYREHIRKALQEPNTPFQKLIVAYCCSQIHTARLRVLNPHDHSFGGG